MRICRCCHKELPLRAFNKDKSRKDGYYIYCRDCAHKKQKESISKQEERTIARADEIIGGYKISILNHASQTEHKFTIIGTDGFLYQTNDRDDFYKQLKLLV